MEEGPSRQTLGLTRDVAHRGLVLQRHRISAIAQCCVVRGWSSLAGWGRVWGMGRLAKG